MATKITTGLIDSGAITSALITDASITADDLHTTLDLTGKTVTVATATAGDNDTSVASTAFVSTAIANLADSAPSTLDTLNELAAALGDDANYATTTTNAIATKLPLAGGTMTGALAMNTNAITSTGDLTLDAAGDIILDADGDDWKFKNGGLTTLEIKHESSSVDFLLNATNDDFKFKGSDDGSTITALTLDMSDAGTAIFNHDVVLADHGRVLLGNSSDLQLVHDGSNSYIDDAGTGILYVRGNDKIILGKYTGETMVEANVDGTVELYYDNAKKLATESGGVNVTGYMDADNFKINGAQGSDGQVLTSTGSGVAWEAAVSSFASLTDTTVTNADPTITTNPSSGVGTIWVNSTSGETYVCTDATSNANVWKNIGDGTGTIAFSSSGGTKVTTGGYVYHTFTSSGIPCICWNS